MTISKGNPTFQNGKSSKISPAAHHQFPKNPALRADFLVRLLKKRLLSVSESLAASRQVAEVSNRLRAPLGSPADFINLIFGIYGKFWIDIGGAKSEKTFFDVYFFKRIRTHGYCGLNTEDGTYVGRTQCVGYYCSTYAG